MTIKEFSKDYGGLTMGIGGALVSVALFVNSYIHRIDTIDTTLTTFQASVEKRFDRVDDALKPIPMLALEFPEIKRRLELAEAWQRQRR